MEVSVTDAGPCRKILRIHAPKETVAGEIDETVKAVAGVARLKGFRPGKAPLKLVERQYAKEIEGETRDRLVPKLYRAAIAQEGLNPVAVVEVKDVQMGRERGLDFNVTVDLAPELALPDYRGIPLKAEPVAVNDADVDGVVTRLLERMARFEPVAERPAEATDLLTVDFAATVDDKPMTEAFPDQKVFGEAKDFSLFMGEPEFVPGLMAGLTGARAGETRDVAVTFPAEFGVAPLAGKVAQYRVTVKAVSRRILPTFDAELLKHLNAESEAAFRERVRADLEASHQAREAGRRKDVIARYLLERVTCELPQSIVERETRAVAREIVQDIARRGASKDEIVGQQEQIVNHATQSSTDRVRLTYILDHIATAEKIEAEDADVAARLAAMGARYGISAERMREELNKRDAYDSLVADVRASKTLDFLVAQAKVEA